MRLVFNAIENGFNYLPEIIEHTKMQPGQVKSAVYNLVFTAQVRRSVDSDGRHRYDPPKRHKIASSSCWNGATSVFNPTGLK